jgi:hypothetical protein
MASTKFIAGSVASFMGLVNFIPPQLVNKQLKKVADF